MPDKTRQKGKHLTWEDRHEIQRGLRENRSFKEIADIIGCSPDTVSKEIRNHRYHKVREKIAWATQNPIVAGIENHVGAEIFVIKRKDLDVKFLVGNVRLVMSVVQTLWMHLV